MRHGIGYLAAQLLVIFPPWRLFSRTVWAASFVWTLYNNADLDRRFTTMSFHASHLKFKQLKIKQLKIRQVSFRPVPVVGADRPQGGGALMTPMIIACIVAMFALTGAGCAGKEKSSRPDYRSTSSRAPLEVPPGLTRNGGRATAVGDSADPSTYSAYESQANVEQQGSIGGVLPTYENVRLLRTEDERWLEIDGEPADLWPLVVDFWVREQIQLVTENPTTGVIETDWLENYAEITTVAQRWFRNIFGSLLTADSYDKFRVRLERSSSAGKTDLFLTHRGIAADQVPGENNLDVIDTRWVPSESNSDIEAEMLRLLMVHLGLSDDAATQIASTSGVTAPDRATLDLNPEGSRIIVEDAANVAWRRVGVAIDRLGFTVEDRNRSSGTYYLRSVDIGAAEKASDENWLGRLFTRDKSIELKSRVVVAATDVETQSEVRVLDDSGDEDDAEENAEAAERILNLLYQQLK